MRKKRWISIILFAVVVAACAPQAAAEVSQVEEAAIAEPAMAEPGTELAEFNIPGEFEIKLYQGQNVYGSDVVSISSIFAEGKPVVINFYAGMCPTCIVELPRLQAACDQYGDQVNFVLVDIGPFVGLGTERDGANMLEAVKADIPGGMPLSVEVIRDYGILGTPSVLFFFPDGTLHLQYAGLIQQEQINEAITAILQ